MSALKKLAGQTAIYGLSSIIGRFLNYLLVPLYTYIFSTYQYGIVTELYSYAAFFMVIFTYGLETAFFRFYEKEGQQPAVYSTVLWSIFTSTVILTTAVVFVAPFIAEGLGYPEHSDYIVWFGFIVGLDALASIPFAKLRAKNKALKFASFKLLNIGINIGLNLFFLLLCPYILKNYSSGTFFDMAQLIYNPEFGIGYIFISNLAASAVTFLLLIPEMKEIKIGFNKYLWKQMIMYALPLVIVGFSGIINEMIDRILLKFLLPFDNETNQSMIGIYGACYKLSLLMTLFIQAYRYAAEPFFFAQSNQKSAKTTYAATLKYFVITGLLIFLGVMLFLDILKYFIGPEFHEGLVVVPILLMANLFLGIYYTLSIWYKITDKTGLGAYIAIGGAIITIVLNIILIPEIGYVGSAWATLVCYLSMSIASYAFGQYYYKVYYNLKRISVYIIVALALFAADYLIVNEITADLFRYGLKSLLLLLFIIIIYLLERSSFKAETTITDN